MATAKHSCRRDALIGLPGPQARKNHISGTFRSLAWAWFRFWVVGSVVPLKSRVGPPPAPVLPQVEQVVGDICSARPVLWLGVRGQLLFGRGWTQPPCCAVAQ
jgi:hypothetical protein